MTLAAIRYRGLNHTSGRANGPSVARPITTAPVEWYHFLPDPPGELSLLPQYGQYRKLSSTS